MPKRNRSTASYVAPRTPIKLLTDNQKLAWELMKEKTAVFLLGSPGTGKTFLATAFAVQAIETSKQQRLIFTRPGIPADGEDWGALPGELVDKFKPFLQPIYDNLAKIIPGEQKDRRAAIEYASEAKPLAVTRGVSFDHAIAILDEAQNVSRPLLDMWFTRYGTGGKLLICGDPEQSDLRDSPLMRLVERLRPSHRVGVVQFTDDDIVRDDDGFIREYRQLTRGL